MTLESPIINSAIRLGLSQVFTQTLLPSCPKENSRIHHQKGIHPGPCLQKILAGEGMMCLTFLEGSLTSFKCFVSQFVL